MNKTYHACKKLVTNTSIYDGYVKTVEKYSSELISSLNSASSIHDTIHMLSWISNASINKCIADYINTGTVDAEEVVVAWSYAIEKVLLREVMLYQHAKNYHNFDAFCDDYSYEMTSEFLSDCWSIAGLSALDCQPIVDGIGTALNVIEMRGDVERVDDSPSFDFQFCLMRFLLSSSAGQEQAGLELSEYAPFSFLTDALRDNDVAVDGILDLVGWHMDQCSKSLRGDDYQYPLQPYSVIPTWIYACLKRVVSFGDNSERFTGSLLLNDMAKFYVALSDVNVPDSVNGLRSTLLELYPRDMLEIESFWSEFLRKEMHKR